LPGLAIEILCKYFSCPLFVKIEKLKTSRLVFVHKALNIINTGHILVQLCFDTYFLKGHPDFQEQFSVKLSPPFIFPQFTGGGVIKVMKLSNLQSCCILYLSRLSFMQQFNHLCSPFKL